jgi:hypothetical protein
VSPIAKRIIGSFRPSHHNPSAMRLSLSAKALSRANRLDDKGKWPKIAIVTPTHLALTQLMTRNWRDGLR